MNKRLFDETSDSELEYVYIPSKKQKKKRRYLPYENGKKTKLKYADKDGPGHRDSADVQVLDNRIYFTGKVCTLSVTNLIKQINHYNSEYAKLVISSQNVADIKPKPVYLHIQSYGGSLLACFAAIDAIRSSKIPIYTVVDGFAASCGSLMAAVGAKRFMRPNSFILMHQLSSGLVGKMVEIEDDYKNCTKFMEKIYNIYLETTNMTRDKLIEQLKHDEWWDSDECLSHGIVDEII